MPRHIQVDDPAEDISYDNTSSGLTADDVQAAIDEVAGGGAAMVIGAPVGGTDNNRLLSTDATGDLTDESYATVPISVAGGLVTGEFLRPAAFGTGRLAFGALDASGVGGGDSFAIITEAGNSSQFSVTDIDTLNTYLIVSKNTSNVATINFSPNGTNVDSAAMLGVTTSGVNINGEYTLPTTDGTSNQVLKTDGSGNVSWDTSPGSTWGSITGTLSSQTDLQTALDAKVSDTGDTMTGALFLSRTGTGSTIYLEVQNTTGALWHVGMNNGSDTFGIRKSGGSANTFLISSSTDEVTIDKLIINTSISAGSHVISNVTDPSATQDAATKNYVDTKAPRQLFDHYADAGNTGTGEDDLYSDTIAAGQLSANGQKLEAHYGGVFVSSGTATRQIKVYFGGTAIFDSGALTLSLSSAWTIDVQIIRVSASVVRYRVNMTTQGAALAAYTSAGELTGLTLSNTNVLKITGEAAGVGAATNDIVAKLSSVEWKPSA